MPQLLTRDAFREAVFARSAGRCVFCAAPAQDAHHILERRLFADGGYYLDNGAAVCAEHHRACESTALSVEEVRAAAGITAPVLPEHLYADQAYDKWGNPVLPNGTRLRGELYFDPNVQKALRAGGVLALFRDRVKYPRTWHLPWSDNITADDRVLPSLLDLAAGPIVVTEKLDGENTTLYNNGLHARSVDSGSHPSRHWLRAFHATLAGDIPPGWRICGENLFARHSIAYTDLQSYFYGFSIWDEHNMCLSWAETCEWLALLGIVPVPVLYTGPYDERLLRELPRRLAGPRECEGFVVRSAAAFPYAQFRRRVAKYVRPNHVRTVRHWLHGQPLQPNQLAAGVSLYPWSG